MPCPGERRYGHRGDIADIYRTHARIFTGRVELSLRCDRYLEAQVHLHELIRLQVRECETRLFQILFCDSMPPQEPPFAVRVRIYAGELYDVADPSFFSRSNEISLQFRQVRSDG